MWKEPVGPFLHGGVRIMHESTAYDMILDEGRVEGEIRLLLRQGRKRFGPPDPTTGRGCLDRQFLAGTAGHSLRMICPTESSE